VQKQSYLRNRRLRVFGGPNGSGKSTLLNQIDAKFVLGYYINADEIEKELKTSKKIILSDYGIKDLNQNNFSNLLRSHSIIKKAKEDGYRIDLFFEKGSIVNPDKNSHSYEAAFIADVIRIEILKRGSKFTFETVMSHNSKVKFLKQTQSLGYKNYLYYISTESPLINVERVKQRVEMGGHPVSRKKIKSRYYNSLDNLKDAVRYTYRTFIFDNSGSNPRLILEVFEGEDVTFYHDEIPHWVDKYLL